MAATLALGAAVLADGYVPITGEGSPYVLKWEQSPIRFEVKLSSTRNLSDGHSPASSVADAMATWNAHLGATQFATQTVAPGMADYGNGVNEIVMDDTVNGDAFPAGVLAVTLNQGESNAIAESDVIFNRGLAWDSYPGVLRAAMDIRRVAIHELGHVLGLDHPDEQGQQVSAIMNSRVSHIDRLMPDDISGGQKLYGAPGFMPANDLFARAIDIGQLAEEWIRLTGSNVAAQKESGEPNHAGSTSGHSVWWKWTAPGNTRATITTMGSWFDTVLAVYTGSTVPSLAPVVSNDDVSSGVIRTSEVSFDAVAGVTYFVAVDGWGDADNSRLGHTGWISLNFTHTTLQTPPIIAAQPLATQVQAGVEAGFSVRVNGYPYPAFRWQRQNLDGTWADLANDSTYGAADSPDLRIRTTLAMNGQQFRCIVTNPLGTAISQSAILSVTPGELPVFVTQPVGGVWYVGMDTGLQSEASGGFPTYQWYRDGVPLPRGGETWSANYSLPNVQESDSGVYQVVATNPSGAVASEKVRLTVKPVTGVIAVRAVERRTLFKRADGSRWRMGIVFPHGALIGTPAPFSTDPAEAVTPAVAMGDAQELSVRPDGTLWVSGNNEHGELGLGDTQGRYRSTYLTDEVLAVAAGCYTSYFIKRDGSLWGMGDNSLGQLGAGAASDYYTPVRIAEGVIAVAAYYQHALFIKADGSLWGMGSNAQGQLGDGTTTNRHEPVRIAESVASISAGQTSSIFVKHDGTAWGMGRNSTGKLGDGTTTDRRNPVRVMEDVLEVAAGFDHSLFLKSDGSLWIAGDVDSQFDQPDGAIAMTPIQVATRVITMAAGNHGSFFVAENGSLWTTGIDDDAKLGLGGGMPLWSPRQWVRTPREIAGGPVALPAPVSGLEVPGAPEGRIFLRWMPAPDATRYEVWRSTTSSRTSAERIAANVAHALYSDFTASGGVTYWYWIRAINPAGAGAFGLPVRAGGDAIVGLPPSGTAPSVGQSISLAVDAESGAAYQWRHNGAHVEGATDSTLVIQNLQPRLAGLYDVSITKAGAASASLPAIVGVASTAKVTGLGAEVGADIVHANGNVYDQVLLEGGAVTITADPRQIVRLSYLDLSDDIVQVEFSGAGSLTLTLDNASGPAPATNYHQPAIAYVRGHASIVVTGADESTNLSVFSVGRMTAINQTLFRDDVLYDGMADIAAVAISSRNGRFGGLRTGNASYLGTRGVTGIYAPNVQFEGPVVVGDITAADRASPTLVVGGALEVRLAGGDLRQENGAPVEVGGFTQLRVTPGTDSHGFVLPAQPVDADLERLGVSVSSDASPAQ